MAVCSRSSTGTAARKRTCWPGCRAGSRSTWLSSRRRPPRRKRRPRMPRILIVDDEPDNLALLTRRLGRRGFDVITAGNGLDGLAKAKAEPPDLVLMDVKMPDMDGYEATRRLKADDATRGIPVV